MSFNEIFRNNLHTVNRFAEISWIIKHETDLWRSTRAKEGYSENGASGLWLRPPTKADPSNHNKNDAGPWWVQEVAAERQTCTLHHRSRQSVTMFITITSNKPESTPDKTKLLFKFNLITFKLLQPPICCWFIVCKLIPLMFFFRTT